MTHINIFSYVLTCVPAFLYKTAKKKKNNLLTFYVKKDAIDKVIYFLSFHLRLQFNYFIDITCIDLLRTQLRFQLVYVIVSLLTTTRLLLKTFLPDGHKIASIVSLFQGANWYEREIWDMFGIQFINHPDLRRLLTDYFFNGFPLRKDFPLSGYSELRYQENLKKIKYQELKLIQEFRFFETKTPWENTVFNSATLFKNYSVSKVLHADTFVPKVN